MQRSLLIFSLLFIGVLTAAARLRLFPDKLWVVLIGVVVLLLGAACLQCTPRGRVWAAGTAGLAAALVSIFGLAQQLAPLHGEVVWRGTLIAEVLAQQPQWVEVAVLGAAHQVKPPKTPKTIAHHRGPKPHAGDTADWPQFNSWQHRRVKLFHRRFDAATLAPFKVSTQVICNVRLRRDASTLQTLRRLANGGEVWRGYYGGCRRLRGGKHLVARQGAVPMTVIGMRAKLRGRLQRLVNAVPHADARGMVGALLLGDRSGLNAEVRNNLRRAGVYHLAVVSGLHLGLIGLFAYGLAVLMLSLYSPWLLRFDRTLIGRFFALLVMAFYVCLAGAQPPLLRAFILAAVLVAATLLRRPYAPLQALLLTVNALLLGWPLLLFSISFQLTAVATLGILLGVQFHATPLIKGWSERRSAWQRLRIPVMLLLIGVYAWIAILPILLHSFGTFSAWTLATNVVFTPWVGWLLLPLVLLGALAALLSGQLVAALGSLLAALFEPLLYALSVVAGWPGGAVELPVLSAPPIAAATTLLWYGGWLGLLYRQWRGRVE